MYDLSKLRVAIIATDGFEESELVEPMRALKWAGATVHVLSPSLGRIQGFRHLDKTITVEVDRRLQTADPNQYDAVHLPGGTFNADLLRRNPAVREFLLAFDEDDKPIAAICHAPWLLVSADLVKGRTLTSYASIQDDIRNAGGIWVDEEVVINDTLITSRSPDDLRAYSAAVVEFFGREAASMAAA